MHALRAPFADGLYAEAGASRVPTSHNLTLGYARLFGLPLVPFAPADIRSIRYAYGQRTKIVPEGALEWPTGIIDVTAAPPAASFASVRPDDEQLLKIDGGNDRLPHAFAARLSDRIQYECGVRRIEHDAQGARVFGILMSFVQGPKARELGRSPRVEQLRFGLKAIEDVNPGIRRNYEGGFVKVWDRDPWARGAVAYLLPGQVLSLEPHIARPEGRIHFAGEHASSLRGWMQGAFESGRRAASEVDVA